MSSWGFLAMYSPPSSLLVPTHNSPAKHCVLLRNTIQIHMWALPNFCRNKAHTSSDSGIAVSTRPAHYRRLRGQHLPYLVYLGMSDPMRAYTSIWAIGSCDQSSHMVATRSPTSSTFPYSHHVTWLKIKLTVMLSDPTGWRL